jgi:hypothetical protein
MLLHSAAAAEQAGCGERTAYRWMALPSFQEALRQARRQVLNHAVGQLQSASVEAVGTLRSIASDPAAPANSRVSAARTLLEAALRGAELDDLLPRVEALEQHHN